MIKPTIHLNGTSRDELFAQVCSALTEVRQAIRTLSDAAPNGRDYYPQGPSAITTAIKEHGNRIAKLESVRADLQELVEHIADAHANRN